MPVLSYYYTSMLLTKFIMNYLDDNHILADQQFGFRSGRGTVDQLLLVYNDIAKWVDKGLVVDVVFLDYSKAFDVVSHTILLEKLSSLGFDDGLLNWIEMFLRDRFMCVSVSQHLSSPVEVTSGVPQGSVLGPLLFLIYVNSVTKDVSVQWAAYADDFKLSVCFPRGQSSVRSSKIGNLQSSLDSIASVGSSWNLNLNSSKCVVMRFGENEAIFPTNYTIDGKRLKCVKGYKDLGVFVDSNLKFHTHINQVVGRVASMSSNLLRSTVCRSADFMVTLWVSHIRPLIEYGSNVWNVGYMMDDRRLERLQRAWTRQIHGLSELSYHDRLSRIKMFSVYGRLLRVDLVTVWKAFHAEVDVGLSSVFEMANPVGTRGHNYKLAIPICRTEVGRRTFGVRVVNIWNSLPADVVEASSLDTFKRGLDAHLGEVLYSVV